jgi:hypothetical protein
MPMTASAQSTIAITTIAPLQSRTWYSSRPASPVISVTR